MSLITVQGTGMLGVPGVAARTFDAVAKTGTSVPLISQASSEQSICFTVPIDAAEKVRSALEKHLPERSNDVTLTASLFRRPSGLYRLLVLVCDTLPA
jgi:aspartokinase